MSSFSYLDAIKLEKMFWHGRKSLIAMNEELLAKQVSHGDLHYENIMRACSDTTESTASSYQYRLIDFENAIWSNAPPAVRRDLFGRDINHFMKYL